MSLSPRLKIAHTYQEGGIRLHEPRAAQIHIFHTMQGLQRAGHEVSLLALQGRQVLYTQDLQVFKTGGASHYASLGLSGNRGFKLFESGIRRLQAFLNFPYLALFDSYRMAEAAAINLKGYHLIHERFNLLSLGGAWASRRLGIPFVLEVNADLLEQRRFKGVEEQGLRQLFAAWATRTCFKTASRIICISPRLKEHLHSKWNVEEDKLTVLPCAADVDAFQPTDHTEAVRKRLGLTTEPVVMWVGGFYPWHDLDLLLASFSQVLQENPKARLILVGDGPSRASVENSIRNGGLQQAVILTGTIAHAEVPEFLSIADLAVVPAAPVPASQGGTGTPLKLFEYMAAGKAIVATDLNQAADVIKNGHTGILVPAGDAHRFAGVILSLLEDPAERARLGRNARQQAVERYSWEEYTQQLEEIYRSVLENTPSIFTTTQIA